MGETVLSRTLESFKVSKHCITFVTIISVSSSYVLHWGKESLELDYKIMHFVLAGVEKTRLTHPPRRLTEYYIINDSDVGRLVFFLNPVRIWVIPW